MGRRIEDMITLWPATLDVDVVGYDSELGGSLAPSGFGGFAIDVFRTDASDSSIIVAFVEQVPNLTSFDARVVFGDDEEVATFTLDPLSDGHAYDATSAGFVTLIHSNYADTNFPLELYLTGYDDTDDVGHFHTSEHGAWNVAPVHENGGAVRVGSVPAPPVCYPKHRGGWDSDDESFQHYP